jgi:GDPmannose 4,6-dehydratase
MKKALITGVLGQDGYYLAEYLLGIGYEVHGIYKKKEFQIIPEWKGSKINLYDFDIVEFEKLEKLIVKIQPDEIYHLAAFHFSSQNQLNYNITFQPFSEVNIMVIDKILSLIYNQKYNTRIFYASSSHVFGDVKYFPQTELTPFAPNSFYSISKVAASNLCKFYRNQFGLYISVGILYNHESVRRNSTFVTTQIAEAAALASLGSEVKLSLRNLDAIVDWGAAKDYVIAMWHTLQQEESDDYIISSGIPRTIKDFTKVAFEYVGLEASKYVYQNIPNVSRLANSVFIGDPTKIRVQCKWAPKFSFEELVSEMVQFKINEIKSEDIHS